MGEDMIKPERNSREEPEKSVKEPERAEAGRKRAEAKPRRSEEKFKAIFEPSPIGILLYDADGMLLEINRSGLDILGVSDLKEIGDFNLLEALDPPDRIKADLNSGAIARFEAELDFERFKLHGLQQTTRSGQRHLLVIIRPMKSGNDLFGHLVQVQDITSQKRSQEALKESEQRLLQAQKMEAMGILVSGVAHEINNPINLIMFNAAVMKNVWKDFLPILEKEAAVEPGKKYGGLTYDYLRKKLSRLLLDTEMASERIANVVRLLKDFSRQTDMADKTRMRINEAVENAIKLARTTLRKSDIAVRTNLGRGVPMIMGNLQSIEQAVLNLLLNAVQAMEGGRGDIDIVTVYDKGKDQVVFSIADTGPGIDPSISDRIFDPFFTTNQAAGGTGLGLAITYNIVKDHGGRITVCGEKGKGTAFTITIPTEREVARKKILVVDDEKAERKTIRRIFSKNPRFEVIEAENGIDALLKLGSLFPDLLILDINMPEMDGLEVCRAIKKDPGLRDVKVMILTGRPQDRKVRRIVELGFTHIHEKPFRLNTLREVVNDILKEPGRY